MTRRSPHVCFVRLKVLEVASGYVMVSQNGFMGGEVFKMPMNADLRAEPPELGRTYAFTIGKWQAERNGWPWTENYE